MHSIARYHTLRLCGSAGGAGPYFFKSIQAAAFTVAAEHENINGVPVGALLYGCI